MENGLIMAIKYSSLSGGTTPIGASSLLYSGAAPYGGTSLTGLSLAAGTYAVVLNQANAERGLLTTANNGNFVLDGNRPNYVTLTTTETTFNIGGGISTGYANILLGRSSIKNFAANSNDTIWAAAVDEQANNTFRMRTSTDFVTWVSNTPTNFNSNFYIYVNTRRCGPYVAATRNSTTSNFAFTSDAITWTTASLPGSTYYRAYIHIDYSSSLGKWIVYGDTASSDTPAGACVAISTNGTTWSQVSATTLGFSASGSYLYGCALGATATNKYVAVGTSGGTTPKIAASTDGITWTAPTVPTIAGNTSISGVVWNATIGKYLAGTSVTNTFILSTDGVTWTTQTIDLYAYEQIHTLSNMFWIRSQTASKIAYSTNGTTWNYIKSLESGYYFPENGWVQDDGSQFLPRYNGKGADRFMSTAQDNSSVYGTNKHMLISWEPLTYMVYSTAIATV